jgi:hypothetical protein
MTCDEFDDQFIEYRGHLQDEVKRLNNFIAVYLQIQHRKADMLGELNLAPAFFQTVESALFSAVILWIDKLLDESGERGIFNFLALVEHNQKWLSAAELKRRKGYPDDHWMLRDRTKITAKTVEADRDRIRGLNGLASIRLRRDKFHGHFDKKYFFERSKISEDAPILRTDLEQAVQAMGSIINGYSADFDGSVHSWIPVNIDDLSTLLKHASKGTRGSKAA